MDNNGGGEGRSADFGTEEITANLRIRRAHVVARGAKPRPVVAPPPLPKSHGGDSISARPTCKLASQELDGLIADKHRRASVTDLHVTIEVVNELHHSDHHGPPPVPPRLAHTLRRTPAAGVMALADPRLASGSGSQVVVDEVSREPAAVTNEAAPAPSRTKDLMLGLTIGFMLVAVVFTALAVL